MADEPETPPREADHLIYAGLLGLAVAASLQLMDKPELDLTQLVAVYSFAVSVPLLAAGFVTDYARRAGAIVPWWRDVLGIGGAVCAVAGFGALYCHIAAGVGAMFAVACFVGLLLVRRF